MALINFRLMLHFYTPYLQGMQNWKSGMKQINGIQKEVIFYWSNWNSQKSKDKSFNCVQSIITVSTSSGVLQAVLELVLTMTE